MNIPTHLDLFSGIGGFALAAKWAGFKTKAFCEIDPFCQKVLEKNFPNICIFKDIKTLEITQHFDLLTAGFPCQPFSQAGNKKGKEDERYLWPETLRIIKQCKPTWIIIENVRGIIPILLEEMCSSLEREFYSYECLLLPASSAKAPHRRDRIWLIAHNNRERSNHRINYRPEGQVFQDSNWNLEEIKQKWSQFIPNTWENLSARDWLQYNTKFSRGNDGISTRLDKDRIKSLGNAIVPQVIYPILQFIRNNCNGL